jgi:xanthine dehydrogenase accessory factor
MTQSPTSIALSSFAPPSFAQDMNIADVPLVLIRISKARGSTPREEGAYMVVSADTFSGTIGGGRLEWDAVAAARRMLAEGGEEQQLDVALGPAIGQCCGGHVTLDLTKITQADIEILAAQEAVSAAAAPEVIIYGAGHVGRALARALSLLPLRVTLTDSRAEELALAHDLAVKVVPSETPVMLAEAASNDAAHVIMTHSHALDSLIAAAVMERDAFRYLGIIGSRTKRNSFRKAFREMGFSSDMIARVVCPIGGSDVKDKRPEVIAALTTAEIVRTVLGRNGG